MTTKVMNGLDLQSQRIQSLADPSTGTDAATKQYVDNVARGLSWHDSVIAASTANVTISSAPSTLDGVSLTSGDRVLLKNQSTAAENGVYIFNGAASALTRAADMAAAAVLTTGTAVSTESGTTQANQIWHVTTPADGTWTVATTSTTWSQLGGGVGVTSFQTRTGAVTLTKADVTGTGLAAADVNATAKFAANVGDGAATAIDVTHNLGTRDVHVAVYDSATFAEIIVDITRPTVNKVTLTFAVAPASNAYRAVVVG